MDTLFSTSSTFASLSLRDLVEARDQFHFHLMNKRNVVATAIGLYRVRKKDAWPSREDPAPFAPRSAKRERRTLFNSEVRPYSWPCVYVFVSSWQYEEDLAADNPSDVVPKTLYLPDGRAVPVCVIEAREQPWTTDLRVDPLRLTPRNVLGPGVGLINRDGQGMPRIATAGCLVRDGERYYVLTNRHAVGPTGTPIEALQIHRSPRVGASVDEALVRRDFAEVYPNLRSTRQRLLMDIGLVAVDDLLQWKTEVPGISPIGPVLNLYDNSLSLKLITMKVVGISAISGVIRGEVHGLFYRYKTMGGFDYLSDFLIGPETCALTGDAASAADSLENDASRNVSLGVHHGDSGTLLFIEHFDDDKAGEADIRPRAAGAIPGASLAPAEMKGSDSVAPVVQSPDVSRSSDAGQKAAAAKRPTYYPFALLWGKEEFFADDRVLTRPYALATSLSTALDLLNLDFVIDINRDQSYIWGWVGHYAIGRALPLPVDLVTSTKLRKLLETNLDLLALDPDAALDNNVRVQERPGDDPRFVPLADVPDNVWKSNVNFTMAPGSDGKKHHQVGPGSRGKDDNPNHFADLDLVYKNNKTFLALNEEDPDTYLRPAAWVTYFADMKPKFKQWADLIGQEDKSNHWGALPFRVHQLFDVMVAAAKGKDAASFLCAGGVLIHYVGDACQPLHASYLSNGDPERVVKRPRSDGYKLEADGVHTGYEDDMIAYGYQEDDLATKLKNGIAAMAQDAAEAIAPVGTGYEASKAIIDLIAKTQDTLSPRTIVDKWVALAGTPAKDKAKQMWGSFDQRTITCMARGARYLAAIWQGAWTAGDGDTNLDPEATIGQSQLMLLYNGPDFARSVALDQYPQDPNADWSKLG